MYRFYLTVSGSVLLYAGDLRFLSGHTLFQTNNNRYKL